MPGLPPVDHIDMSFAAEGHPGNMEAHYDLQLFLLPPEEMAAIR